jgi:mycofactocin precursor
MCQAVNMTPATLTLPAPPAADVLAQDALLTELANGELLFEESLIEEVSIDGMCGVY